MSTDTDGARYVYILEIKKSTTPCRSTRALDMRPHTMTCVFQPEQPSQPTLCPTREGSRGLSIKHPCSQLARNASVEILGLLERMAAIDDFLHATPAIHSFLELLFGARRGEESQTWRTKEIVRTGPPRRRRRILEDRIQRLLHMRRPDGCKSKRRARMMYAIMQF